MSTILQHNLLKSILFRTDKRALWKWVDDTFNRQVVLLGII